MSRKITPEQSTRLGQLSHVAWVSYFKNLADNFKLLDGFHYLELAKWDSFMTELRAAQMPSPVLVMDELIYVPSGGKSASYLQQVNGAITILGLIEPHGVYSENEWAEYMLYLAQQVRAKMVLDKSVCNLLQGLDTNSMTLESIDKLAQYWGWRFDFTAVVEDRLNLDRNEWTYLPYEHL